MLSIQFYQLRENCTVLENVTMPEQHGRIIAIASKLFFDTINIGCPLGILVNLFALLVFHSAAWKNSLNTHILKYLTLFEILFNLSLMISTNLNHASTLTSGDARPLITAFTAINLTLRIFLFWMQICRNWMVVWLSCYRYECVCRSAAVLAANSSRSHSNRPSQFSQIKVFTGRPRINRIVWLVNLALLGAVLPRMLEIVREFCAFENFEIHTPLTYNKYYIIVYQGLTMFLIQSGGPVIIVLVTSLSVARTIVRMRRRRQHLFATTSSKNSNDNNNNNNSGGGNNNRSSRANPKNSEKKEREKAGENSMKMQKCRETDRDCEDLEEQQQEDVECQLITSKHETSCQSPQTLTCSTMTSSGNATTTTAAAAAGGRGGPASATCQRKRYEPSGDRPILIMCFAFFILQMPPFFSKLLESYLQIHRYLFLNKLLMIIGNISVLINSLTTITIFMLFNETVHEIMVGWTAWCRGRVANLQHPAA